MHFLLYGGPKVSRQFQFTHGSFNLLTAVSISLTAVLICSRQFQFAHGSFNLAHGSFNLLTAVSISLMMRLQWISANIGHAGCQVLWEILKYAAKLLITFVSQPNSELRHEVGKFGAHKAVNSEFVLFFFCLGKTIFSSEWYF